MRFLPVGLDLRDRSCVVVGGGPVGTRKVRSLLRVGAHVTVVSPTVTDELEDLARAGRVHWNRTTFQPSHLDGARLVVLATDDPEANDLVAREARRQGCLLCDATSRARSDIIFGALHEADGLTVAAFTDGHDPARSKRTRDRIAAWLQSGPGDDGATPTRRGTLLVLVAHGSRNPDWGRPLEALTDAIRVGADADNIRLAYSQFASPTLEDVVAEAAADPDIRRVRVLPLFMTRDGHVERDIRPVVDDLRRAYDAVEIEMLPPVGALDSFQDLLVDLAREVTR